MVPSMNNKMLQSAKSYNKMLIFQYASKARVVYTIFKKNQVRKDTYATKVLKNASVVYLNNNNNNPLFAHEVLNA